MSTAKERNAKLAAGRDDDVDRDERDDDDDGDNISKVRRAAERGHEEEVTVELEDEEEKPKGGDDDEPGQSRADKKRERGRGFAQQRDEFAGMLNESREREAHLLRILDTVTKRTAEPAKGGEEKSPEQVELDGVNANLRLLAARARALGDRITQAQEDELTAEADKLQLQKQRLITRITLKEEGASKGGGERGGISDQERQRIVQDAQFAQVREEFEDVYTYDPRRNGGYPALRWAKGRLEQLIADSDAGVFTMKLMRKALAEAAVKYGMRRETSPGHKRKFESVSRGGGGGGDEKKITLSKAQVRMGNARFSHIKDPKARMQAIAKSIKARAARG